MREIIQAEPILDSVSKWTRGKPLFFALLNKPFINLKLLVSPQLLSSSNDVTNNHVTKCKLLKRINNYRYTFNNLNIKGTGIHKSKGAVEGVWDTRDPWSQEWSRRYRGTYDTVTWCWFSPRDDCASSSPERSDHHVFWAWVWVWSCFMKVIEFSEN